MEKVKYVERTFLGKLSRVFHEFPCLYQTHPLYDGLLYQRFDIGLEQLSYAKRLPHKIGKSYVQLLNKDDCDSLDQCKYVKVAPLDVCSVGLRGRTMGCGPRGP